MSSELYYLTLVTILTAVLWAPYILNRFAVWGIFDTVGYPTDPKPQSPWAARLQRAHTNAIENLVVFAVLVLIAQIAGISSSITVTACVVYFWARVVHAIAYALGIPWVRTLAFIAGFFAQVAVAWQLLVSVPGAT
ncbi:MAPEG family protein [Microbulbifer sp.]|uniref:MAPEG family protein n=1 Tax=Microbulbifer sp. TaxID=1908541 RepID=UPI002F92C638